MKTLITRTLSGAVFVAVVIGAILFSKETTAILFFLLTGLALYEFYTNLVKRGIHVQKITGIVVGLLVYSLFAFVTFKEDFFVMALIVPALFSIFIVELYRKKENPFTNIAYTILGIVYIAFPFGVLCMLSKIGEHYSPLVLLSIFIITWTNDTFAYLTGVLIGKHRLFERHSPKKSWEGFIGGIVFSVVAAFVMSWLSNTNLALVHWIVIALIISIVGTLGDLVESMFKRSLDIKDFGNIMPGHGGILDRFDSILISAPFVACYLLFEIFIKI